MGYPTCKVLVQSLIVIIFSVIPISSIAWNAMGHMVVAQIAYANLKPNVRKTVDNMVQNFNQEYPDMKTFLNLAYWPDEIRSQHINTYARWHYINSPFSMDGTPLKDTVSTDNAVWAITNIKSAVHNGNGNPFERVRFLAFFAHIVGDLHQPLHTITYISSNHPNGDRGGNQYYIRYDKLHIRLHEIWDDGLGLFNKPHTVNNAVIIARSIMRRYPKTYFGNLTYNLEPKDWVLEGISSARKYCYNTPENADATPEYISGAKDIVEQKVALAGYRLAELLNSLL